MSLINLSTNLKSLKFGKDRPGGGSSGQPYMKKDIPDKDSPTILDTDFIWRGGLKAPIRAAEDVARLSKYLFDPKSPRGVLFVAKQNLLSRTAVSTESSTGSAYAGEGLNGGVYTPLSTLAQAGVGWAGSHLNKQGIDPTSPMTGVSSNGLFDKLGLNRYENVVWGNNKIETNKLTSDTTGSFSNRLLKYWVNNEKNKNPSPFLTTYEGGPGSSLGIGSTKIRFATDGNGNALKTGMNNSLAISNPKYFKEGGLTRPETQVNYNELLGASIKQDLNEFDKGINSSGDFTTMYNPSILPYSTLSKYNPTGLSLSGSGAYQTVKPRTTELSQTTYKDLINSILNEKYNRELISTSIFDKTRGQWELTSRLNNEDNRIPVYSSLNTLYNDEVKRWDKYGGGTEPKPHKKGYLANLDKNAGGYILEGNKFVSTNNNYPGGIAPDFRLTDRKTRGFNDSVFISNEINDQKKKWIVNKRLDKKTIQKIQYSGNESSFMNSKPLNQEDGLIPFNIQIIDSTSDGESGPTLKFKSYIDGMSDSYSAGWKDQRYMGRAESFHKYETFDRDMSFNFIIVADNENNLDEMYKMLNTLASSLAPKYSNAGYMTGNLHRVTVGNYINRQYGIIKGFTFEISDEYPWSIDQKVPLYIKVSGFKFTPIHNFRPEYSSTGNRKYIRPDEEAQVQNI
jgi:hypothetical protein